MEECCEKCRFRCDCGNPLHGTHASSCMNRDCTCHQSKNEQHEVD